MCQRLALVVFKIAPHERCTWARKWQLLLSDPSARKKDLYPSCDLQAKCSVNVTQSPIWLRSSKFSFFWKRVSVRFSLSRMMKFWRYFASKVENNALLSKREKHKWKQCFPTSTLTDICAKFFFNSHHVRCFFCTRWKHFFSSKVGTMFRFLRQRQDQKHSWQGRSTVNCFLSLLAAAVLKGSYFCEQLVFFGKPSSKASGVVSWWSTLEKWHFPHFCCVKHVILCLFLQTQPVFPQLRNLIRVHSSLCKLLGLTCPVKWLIMYRWLIVQRLKRKKKKKTRLQGLFSKGRYTKSLRSSLFFNTDNT